MDMRKKKTLLEYIEYIKTRKKILAGINKQKFLNVVIMFY